MSLIQTSTNKSSKKITPNKGGSKSKAMGKAASKKAEGKGPSKGPKKGYVPTAPSSLDETMTGPHDIVCGRGCGHFVKSKGNVAFRKLVEQNFSRYEAAEKTYKVDISREIVNQIRKLNGRFLFFNSQTKVWEDMSDRKAIEKTSQTFRDLRSKPFVSHLGGSGNGETNADETVNHGSGDEKGNRESGVEMANRGSGIETTIRESIDEETHQESDDEETRQESGDDMPHRESSDETSDQGSGDDDSTHREKERWSVGSGKVSQSNAFTPPRPNNPRCATWAKGWKLWSQYRRQHGTPHVPDDFYDTTLVHWVQEQRETYAMWKRDKSSTFLTKAAWDLLEMMGFDFAPSGKGGRKQKRRSVGSKRRSKAKRKRRSDSVSMDDSTSSSRGKRNYGSVSGDSQATPSSGVGVEDADSLPLAEDLSSNSEED